jgi:protein involved in polysaccharide export with SLBB domain
LPALVLSSVYALGFLLLTGCSTSHPPTKPTPVGLNQPAPAPGSPGAFDASLSRSPDTLRVGEMILVEFSGVGDPPPQHTERIKMDGRITLPSIGSVEAAGKTRGELEQAIHDRYVPNYYRQLTVIVRNEGRFFYVKGQVKNPSQYQYLKEMTVLRAIAVAGDFTDFAKRTQVLVTRSDGRKITVNCIKAQRDDRLDIPIYPDDTIEVPRRYF